MRLKKSWSLFNLRRAWVWLAVGWLGLCQAAERPVDAWSVRGDAAFHHALGMPAIVNALAQDRRGLLWLGSQAGLMRWDGYKLRTFLADAAGTGTLPDSFVYALQVDSRGRLWVGTSAGGLARYDEATERFETPVPASALSRRSVLSIAEDRDGSLLLGTGGGLDRLDPVHHTVRRHAQWAAELGLPAAAVTTVLIDRRGALWAGTERGVYRRDGNGRFVKVLLRGLKAGQDDTTTVLEDSDGRLWVGTRAHGVFAIEPGAAQARPLHELVAAPPQGEQAAVVQTLIEARPGEVWAGTLGQGILRIDTRRWRIAHARHVENVAGSLPKDDVAALFRDRQGLVWVATDVGLSFHNADQTGIATWFGHDGRSTIHGVGLTSSNIPYLLPMPDGTVWLSTGESGIDIVSPGGGRVRRVQPVASLPLSALPDGRVFCMLLAPGGREVYAGTRSGLYRIDANTLQAQRITLPGLAPTAEIWALAWHADSLWVGGIDGLWRAQPGKGSAWRVVAHEDASQLGDQRITALLADPAGGVWVGTRSGLVQVDPATMHVRQFAQDAPGRPGLPSGFIASIARDGQGRVWVAGYGAGIRVFEPSPDGVGKLRRISTAEGLTTNAVNALAIDQQGDVWASTDDGIARIAPDTLQVEAIGPADGLGIQAYWGNAAGIAASGHVLFGGVGGLTIVEPRQWAGRGSQPPQLAVTEVRLGDAPPITTFAPGSPALQLKSDRRSLLVEFAGLHLSAPEAVRYQYRLRGIDSDWVTTDASRRFAAYTNLPPGDHLLELRAASPRGPWSSASTVPFHIPPAWHEAMWVRWAAGFVSAGVLLLMMHARTLVLKRRQRVLQALVAERTQQLEESQRQLERIAYFDGLTGLANRRMFNDELKRMVAACQRSGRCAALVLIDLDHFKQVNDTLGHDAGDAMLVAVAERLNSAVRETDRVARLGGDEFAILLPEVEGSAAVERVCERIFSAFVLPVVHKGNVLQLRASVGAALCPQDAQSQDELYKAADIALYAAKRAGRNSWRVADRKSIESGQADRATNH